MQINKQTPFGQSRIEQGTDTISSSKSISQLAASTAALIALTSATSVLSGCDDKKMTPAPTTTSATAQKSADKPVSKPFILQPPKVALTDKHITPKDGEISVSGSCYKVMKVVGDKKGRSVPGMGSSTNDNMCDSSSRLVEVKDGSKVAFWSRDDNFSIMFGKKPDIFKCGGAHYGIPPNHLQMSDSYGLYLQDSIKDPIFAERKYIDWDGAYYMSSHNIPMKASANNGYYCLVTF